jgi:hypothetical protein
MSVADSVKLFSVPTRASSLPASEKSAGALANTSTAGAVASITTPPSIISIFFVPAIVVISSTTYFLGREPMMAEGKSSQVSSTGYCGTREPVEVVTLIASKKAQASSAMGLPNLSCKKMSIISCLPAMQLSGATILESGAEKAPATTVTKEL